MCLGLRACICIRATTWPRYSNHAPEKPGVGLAHWKALYHHWPISRIPVLEWYPGSRNRGSSCLVAMGKLVYMWVCGASPVGLITVICGGFVHCHSVSWGSIF